MKLRVNGHELTIDASVETVEQLLDYLQLNKELAIVELNANILEKDVRDDVRIQAGDCVEIVQFVGGG
ncbi:MAG: sulfur carrier protein ThiS [Lysinibacillus sp.]